MPSLERLLRESRWSSGLPQAVLAKVCAETAERLVPQGGYVCRKGDPVLYWVGVIEGMVKISSVSPQGKAVTFTGVREGGWFGEGSLLRTDPWRYDAVALRDSRVALMPRETFAGLLDGHLAFNRYLLDQLNERLAQFIGTVEFDRLLRPEARVARCVAGLFNPVLYPGRDRALQVSQEEIGYLCGVSRQRVNRALKLLEAEGLLRAEYGRVTVLALERLRVFE